MQYILNKIGECSGCVFFNRQYDHEKCRYCERNPAIATALKDNKTKPDKGLLPDGVFDEPPGSPLSKISDANKAELGEMGVNPGAVDALMKKHDLRSNPLTRKRP